MQLKPETRIIGIDDGAFIRSDDDTMVVGVIFRGGYWIDGMVCTTVKVDGMDATNCLIDMINNCKYKDLRVVMISGITLAGFNVVDIQLLSEKTGLPVIVVIEKLPDFKKIMSAVQNVSNTAERVSYMKRAGKVYKAHNEVYFQVYGMEIEIARKLIIKTSTHSHIPEPLRVSHLIASALTRGESSKR